MLLLLYLLLASQASPAYSATLKLGSRAYQDYGLLKHYGCALPLNGFESMPWDDLLKACDVLDYMPTHMTCVPPLQGKDSFQLCVGTCCVVRLGQQP